MTTTTDTPQTPPATHPPEPEPHPTPRTTTTTRVSRAVTRCITAISVTICTAVLASIWLRPEHVPVLIIISAAAATTTAIATLMTRPTGTRTSYLAADAACHAAIIAAAATYICAVVANGPWWRLSNLLIIAVAVTLIEPWYWQRLRARRHRAAVEKRLRERAVKEALDKALDDGGGTVYEQALRAAKVDVRVTGAVKLPNDAGVTLTLTHPDGGTSHNGLTQKTEAVEIALANRLSAPIARGAVLVEQDPKAPANQTQMTILTRDILAETIPYPDEELTRPTTCRDLICLGRRPNGQDVAIDAYKAHGLVVSRTDGGKTTLLNNLMAHFARAEDTVLWCLAGAKIVDWLGAWYRAYLIKGKAARPVVDLPATDPDEVAKALADAIAGIDYRQTLPSSKEHGGQKIDKRLPRIIIMIDEAMPLLKSTKPYPVHSRNRQMTISEMITNIKSQGRSTGVQCILVNQRGISTMMGAESSNIKSQDRVRIMLPSDGGMETSSVFSGRSTHVNPHVPTGAIWVEDGKQYKWPIVGKGYLLSDEQIDFLGENTDQWNAPIDEGTAAAMRHYTGRYTRPAQRELLDQLAYGQMHHDIATTLDALAQATGTATTEPTADDRTHDAKPATSAGGLDVAISNLISKATPPRVRADTDLTKDDFDAMWGTEATAPASGDGDRHLVNLIKEYANATDSDTIPVRELTAWLRDRYPSLPQGDQASSLVKKVLAPYGVNPDRPNRSRGGSRVTLYYTHQIRSIP